MKKHIKDYDVFKETISQNNVLAMAEQLAMYETRFLIGYMGSRMQLQAYLSTSLFIAS